jgi:hypothetical protein
MHGGRQFWEKEAGVGDNHGKEGKEKVTRSCLLVFSFWFFNVVVNKKNSLI